MTDLVVELIYSALMIINLILLVPVLFRKNKVKIDYVYLIMSTLIIVWQIIEIVISLSTNAHLVAFLYMARLVAIVFIPIAFFYLVALFYDKARKVPRWYSYTLFIGAVAVSLLALTSGMHGFFWVDGLKIVSLDPLLTIEGTPNFGYLVAFIFTQIPVLGVLVTVLSQYKKLPAIYHSSVTILLWCLVAYTLMVAIYLSGILEGLGLDASLIGVCVVNFFLYLAIMSKDEADYLKVWQSDVYNYLDEAVLILDEKSKIIDANQIAKKIFAGVDIVLENKDHQELLTEITIADNIYLRHLENGNRTTYSEDLYLTNGEYPAIYEVKRSTIHKLKTTGSGEFIILGEVTRNRLYIERLQGLAGVDTLTGLANRFSYEQILHDWDTPQNLPLSIIMGDLNDLKKLNDGFGHQAGDGLLKTAAGILKQNCPDDGIVARVGGDEFVILAKNCTNEKAQSIIADIKKGVAQTNGLPHAISIALGSATKNEVSENMNALYIQADERMYANKKDKGVLA